MKTKRDRAIERGWRNCEDVGRRKIREKEQLDEEHSGVRYEDAKGD